MPRFLSRVLAAVLAGSACAPLIAEDAPAADTMVSVTLTDPGRTLDRLAASPYGRALSTPAGQRLMEQVLAELEGPAGAVGMEPEAIVRAITSLQFAVAGMAHGDWGPMPEVRVQLETTALAERIYALASARLNDVTAQNLVPGATAVAANGNKLLAQHPGGVVFSENGATGNWWPVTPNEADLVVTWSPTAIRDAIAPYEEQVAGMINGLPGGTVTWQVIETGLRQVVTLDRDPGDLAPIDTSLLGHVPASALAVSAIGLDGAGLWNGPIGNLLQSQPEALAEIDAGLSEIGYPGGLEALISGIQGTAMVLIDGAGPWPGIAIAIPRSEGLDALLAGVLSQIGWELPSEGSVAVGQPINGLPRDLATMLAMVGLGATESHWVIGADTVLIEDLVAGRTGGWVETPAAQGLLAMAGETPSVLAWTDTRSILARVLPLIAAGAMDEMPEQAMDVVSVAHAMVAETGASWLVAGSTEHGMQAVSEGPLGGAFAALSVLPVTLSLGAGLAMPVMMEGPQRRASAAESQHFTRVVATTAIAYSMDKGANPDSLQQVLEYGGLPASMLDMNDMLLIPSPMTAAMPMIVTYAIESDSVIVAMGDSSIRVYNDEMAWRILDAAHSVTAQAAAENRQVTAEDWAAALGDEQPW